MILFLPLFCCAAVLSAQVADRVMRLGAALRQGFVRDIDGIAAALLIWQTSISPIWFIIAGAAAGIIEVMVKAPKSAEHKEEPEK